MAFLAVFFFLAKATLSFSKASSRHSSKKLMGHGARRGDSTDMERTQINAICMNQGL